MHGVGGMHGQGCAWQGACMAGGHAWQGGHAWHTVNERAVRILLECILVLTIFILRYK